jgi:hypothetical protein
MGIFGDDKAAKAAKAKRDKEADQALARAKHKGSGSFLSWGGDGRSGTKPGLFGLGSRVVHDIEQENAKKGYYGFFGAKHVSSKAKQAQDRARSKGKGWFG